MRSFVPGLTFLVQVRTLDFFENEPFSSRQRFPISERLWIVTAGEPSALLTAFIERYQSACELGQQLPSMKPELLKSMVRKPRLAKK